MDHTSQVPEKSFSGTHPQLPRSRIPSLLSFFHLRFRHVGIYGGRFIVAANHKGDFSFPKYR
jgi:hypothetical protein